MTKLPEVKQNIVYLTVIVAAVIVAAGSWVAPIWQAQTVHSTFQNIEGNIVDEVNEVDSLLIGKGMDGGYDLLSLMLATVNDRELAQFGNFQDFREFRPPPIFEGTLGEISFFTPAPAITLFPNNVAGTAVNDDDTSAGTCVANGTVLDLDLSNGGTTNIEPLELIGFTVQTPAVYALQNFRVQVCDPNAPAGRQIIIDEVFRETGNQAVSKNFEFGSIPPGTTLRGYVIDAGTEIATHPLWIVGASPTVGEIPILPPGTPTCTLTVEVRDTGNAAEQNASVNIGHEFAPLGDFRVTPANGDAIFDNIPEGPYFVDVFKQGFLPGFADVNCVGAVTTTVILEDPTTDVPLGTLTVNVVDANGNVVTTNPTPLGQQPDPATQSNLFIGISAERFPIHICANDGGDMSDPTHFEFFPECIKDTVDGDPSSAQDAADGQIIFKDIPQGRWFVDVGAFGQGKDCQGFGDVSMINVTTATVTVVCTTATFGP